MYGPYIVLKIICKVTQTTGNPKQEMVLTRELKAKEISKEGRHRLDRYWCEAS